MPQVTDVRSLMDGLAGRDRFKLLQSVDDHDVEAWHLVKSSNLKEIFGTNKTKLKNFLIQRDRIDSLYKAVAEGGNMQDYSMIFIFRDKISHRHKVLEVRRTTGLNPTLHTHSLSERNWFLKSQGYVLIIPKMQ